MKKFIIRALCLALIIFVTAAATFALTMHNLSIETDGDGDSAFVSAFGQTTFCGINGYTVD